jgi:DNA-binding response OmpR family regulator
MPDRILLIEDDRRLAEMLSQYLADHGFAVSACEDAASGLAEVERAEPDLVVLDVMLPDLDGFEVCRRLRADSNVPIVMLTARGDDTDRIVGLEIGADDYLPKPFNPRELLARLRAVLRRRERSGGSDRLPVLRFDDLEIDRDARTVRLAGELRPLTSYQFDLLRVLAESAGRTLSRDTLMERLKGETLSAFDRSIDVHVSRVRQAIEIDPANPTRIVTVRGVGYVFTREGGAQ